jgi:hypothetical protein
MAEKIIELVFGKRGTGKSELAWILLQQHPRKIVFDTLHEHENGVIVSSLDELKALWNKVYRRPFHIVYQPIEPEKEFEIVSELVWACGEVSYLVEEISFYARPKQICMPFMKIIQCGRHRNISLIGTTIKPQGIDHLLTSQAKKVCVFKMNEPGDIDYLKEFVGEAVVAKIEQLKQFEYVEWLDGREELLVKKEAL